MRTCNFTALLALNLHLLNHKNIAKSNDVKQTILNHARCLYFVLQMQIKCKNPTLWLMWMHMWSQANTFDSRCQIKFSGLLALLIER